MMSRLLERLNDALVDLTKLGGVHLGDGAVVSHDAVDLYLYIGSLGVDGGGASGLDEGLEHIGELCVLVKHLLSVLLDFAVAPVGVLLPEVALDGITDAAIFAEDVDHFALKDIHGRAGVMVGVEDVADEVVVAAAVVVVAEVVVSSAVVVSSVVVSSVVVSASVVVVVSSVVVSVVVSAVVAAVVAAVVTEAESVPNVIFPLLSVRNATEPSGP